MKRKVIQLAGSTLVVSLPNRWAQAHGVRKGDEVEVEPAGSVLRIALASKRTGKEARIEAKGIRHVLNRAVGALYKAGYDTIEIVADDPEQFSIVQATVGRTCIGLEIVEQAQNRMLLRILSYLDSTEFDTVLRRLFLSLMSMGEDLVRHLEAGDRKGLENVALRDDNNNRYADFLRRVANQDALPPGLLPGPLYYLLEELERIGDCYRDIARSAAGGKDMPSSCLPTLRLLSVRLRAFYTLFYSFTLAEAERYAEGRATLSVGIGKAIAAAPKQDIPALARCVVLEAALHDMAGALMTIRL
ncbi:phosphate uptake regulator PhoU [Candidatus Woesearchaeota archaeon]|nr:phosphate uptake regulator PhoU [Candidatus Woesearchaeota archaeon]